MRYNLIAFVDALSGNDIFELYDVYSPEHIPLPYHLEHGICQRKKNNSSVIFCGLNKFAFELRNWVIFHICTENIVYSTTRGECRWLHLNSGELAVNGHLVACFGNKSFQIIKMLVEDCSLFFSSFCFFEFGNKSNFCRFKKKWINKNLWIANVC